MFDFRKKPLSLVVICVSAMIAGCVNYKSPPSVIHSNNYSAATNDEERVIPAQSSVFTLQDAIRIGLANNPSYELKRLAVISSYNEFYKYLVTEFLPSVNLSANAGMSRGWSRKVTGWQLLSNKSFSNLGDSYPGGMSGGVTVPIFDGLQKEFDLLANYAETKISEEDQENMRRLLINNITLQYYGLALTKRQIEVYGMDLQFQNQLLDFERYKHSQNLITEESVLNFEFLGLTSESQLVQAQLQYDIQKFALAALLGMTNAEFPNDIQFMSIDEIIENIKIDYEPLAVEYYLDLAIDQRPDLKAVRGELQVKKYDMYAAWGAFSPTISGSGTTSWATSDWLHKGDTNGAQNLNLGLTANWTIWDSGSRIFDLREAYIDIDIAEQDLLIKWIDVVKEVRTAYTQLKSYMLDMNINKKALEIALRQREMVEELYKAGQVTLPRLNEAQSNVTDAELNVATSIISLYTAKSNLQNACGIYRY